MAKMTLKELNQAARDAAKKAWYEARKAYYGAAKAAGDAAAQLPRNLRSLKDFMSRSQEGMKYLEDNAEQSGENIRKMIRDLDRKK
jgi:hypothetical protein